MKNLLLITVLLGALYSYVCEDFNAQHGFNYNCECNEDTWQDYYNSDGHNMEGCWLENANLQGANLDRADLQGAWLYMANLTGANLSWANLYVANLSQANLDSTNFQGADLVEAVLMGVDLSWADLSFADLSGGWLRWATLDMANLTFANLQGNDLEGADLSYADLSWAHLGGAILNMANLTFANLEGACLDGAIDFTQTDYIGTPILEGCAGCGDSDCSYGDVCFEAGYIAGHSDGVVFGMESVDITIDNQAVCEDCYADGEASVDTNNDGLVDEFPVIGIIGDEVLIMTQTSEQSYVDDGATCSDAQDGVISQQVEVSGDVVNLNMIRLYTIHYNCADSDGNQAITKSRTVVVVADYTDENDDGFDDVSYDAGAVSGDLNLDGANDVLDVVMLIDIIINP